MGWSIQMRRDMVPIIFPLSSLGLIPSSESNGATLLPNTFTMQELIRNYYDAFLDLQESAEHTEQPEKNMNVPQIYTIPNGSPPCAIRQLSWLTFSQGPRYQTG